MQIKLKTITIRPTKNINWHQSSEEFEIFKSLHYPAIFSEFIIDNSGLKKTLIEVFNSVQDILYWERLKIVSENNKLRIDYEKNHDITRNCWKFYLDGEGTTIVEKVNLNFYG